MYIFFFCLFSFFPPLYLNYNMCSILLYTFKFHSSFILLGAEFVKSFLLAFSITTGPLATHVELWQENTGNMENLCGARPGFCSLSPD